MMKKITKHVLPALMIAVFLTITGCCVKNLSGKKTMEIPKSGVSLDIPKKKLALRLTEPVPEKDIKFEVNIDRLKTLPDNTMILDRSQWLRLAKLIEEEKPEIKESWGKVTRIAKILLRDGGFKERKNTFLVGRIGVLDRLALLYRLTRHPQLGSFIKKLALFVAEKPITFWINADIRPYNPKAPVGSLESASLASSLALSLSWAGELFSEKEKNIIENALREKGYIPCVRFIETRKVHNNWSAILSGSVYIMAEYFKDEKRKIQARDVISKYLSLVEDDGSYGEPLCYFYYPIGSLIVPMLAMGNKDAKLALCKANLDKSLAWMVYYYYYIRNAEGEMSPHLVVFSDGEFAYFNRTAATTVYFLSCATGNGLGTWLINQFYKGKKPSGWKMLLLLARYSGKEPAMVSPEKAKLPLVKAFDNGLAEIRSSWAPEGTTLALKSGGGTRCKFAHDRPNRNAILLSAFGEYLLVSPNRACYRSPKRMSWDLRTTSFNTVSIDNGNQFTPSIFKFKNVPLDTSGIPHGKPVAELEFASAGKMIDIIQSDAAKAYPEKPEKAKRTVLYVKDPGYFVILDRLKCPQKHTYQIAYYGNNIDGKAKLLQQGDNKWLFTRPKADLLVQIFSSQTAKHLQGKGIMHYKYSFFPGGEGEGELGSSLKISAGTEKAEREVVFCSILFPRPTGSQKDFSAQVEYGKNGIPHLKIINNEICDSFKVNAEKTKEGSWKEIIFERLSKESKVIKTKKIDL
jgi:heparinase II/III-like protein